MLADVGCGYGPIAVTLGLRAPDATIWAVDVNERARELAAANLVDAGVPVAGAGERQGAGRARVCAPEEVPASLRLDALYCNPPVRIGNRGPRRTAAGLVEPPAPRRVRRAGDAQEPGRRLAGAPPGGRRRCTHRRLAIGGGYRVLQVPAAGEAGS